MDLDCLSFDFIFPFISEEFEIEKEKEKEKEKKEEQRKQGEGGEEWNVTDNVRNRKRQMTLHITITLIQ